MLCFHTYDGENTHSLPLAFPEKTNGTVYECGFAVHNNDFAAFVSPARFNATHCGKEVQASSEFRLPFHALAVVFRVVDLS